MILMKKGVKNTLSTFCLKLKKGGFAGDISTVVRVQIPTAREIVEWSIFVILALTGVWLIRKR